ncbi:MAG: histone deacetylase family protein, partial [Candidatus Odinarchaeota archaeon]
MVCGGDKAFVTSEAVPATEEDIRAVHTAMHVMHVREKGLYEISALAAGGAVQAAEIGLSEPCFGLIRPPGHHASAERSWGFCYFNNMAVALTALKRRKRIKTAFVL